MLRKIIKIDREKCNGCGACAEACHEGAIEILEGKAVLTREDYCDGLGDCLPACPTDAISFEIREAAEYDKAAVEKAKVAKKSSCSASGCPGITAKKLSDNENEHASFRHPSSLMQWPCQIKLVPPNAPYFESANLLIAADCTAYAYGSFHRDFMKNHITLIGCPKLDMVDYSEKLKAIIKNNNIKSVKIVRMEVPCCSGIENASKKAIMESGKFIPWQVVTISVDGQIKDI